MLTLTQILLFTLSLSFQRRAAAALPVPSVRRPDPRDDEDPDGAITPDTRPRSEADLFDHAPGHRWCACDVCVCSAGESLGAMAADAAAEAQAVRAVA